MRWVSQLIRDGSWIKEEVDKCIEGEDMGLVLSIPLSLRGKRDQLIWKNSRSGTYITFSGYKYARDMRKSKVLHVEKFTKYLAHKIKVIQEGDSSGHILSWFASSLTLRTTGRSWDSFEECWEFFMQQLKERECRELIPQVVYMLWNIWNTRNNLLL
ncbi:hypothetical protein LIER_21308 [Lithospermum erythrorhizon]|uniref:Uncharacterized protein n=1 Tax=Lithospermum erythrorhizon TaxID=34254 RepID=A0AAV3QS82_LITER